MPVVLKASHTAWVDCSSQLRLRTGQDFNVRFVPLFSVRHLVRRRRDQRLLVVVTQDEIVEEEAENLRPTIKT